jgi:hypothetical protein
VTAVKPTAARRALAVLAVGVLALAGVAAWRMRAGQYLPGSVVSTGTRLVLSASVGQTGAARATVLARVEGSVTH